MTTEETTPNNESEHSVSELASAELSEHDDSTGAVPKEISTTEIMDQDQLINILETSILVAGRPMTMNQLVGLFEQETEKPSRETIKEALSILSDRYADRGIELLEVASGYRIQARQETATYVANLYQEKAPKYSRALIETLVLIAYRQPITRGEIEDVRGVAVSSNIVKTLLDRDWIKILGHRDVPGRPAILGTTRQFLDYFSLKRIDELPTLAEIKALDQIDPELAREMAALESEVEGEGKAEGEGDENTESETDDPDLSNDAVQASEETTEQKLADSGAPDSDSDTESSDELSTETELEVLANLTASQAGDLTSADITLDDDVNLDLGESESETELNTAADGSDEEVGGVGDADSEEVTSEAGSEAPETETPETEFSEPQDSSDGSLDTDQQTDSTEGGVSKETDSGDEDNELLSVANRPESVPDRTLDALHAMTESDTVH